MPFLFKLATLLRLREIAEQTEERRLGEIQKQIRQSRKLLEELRSQRRNLGVQREYCMQQLTTAIEIQGVDQGIRRLLEMETDCHARLVTLEKQHAQQMSVYKAAYAKRELLAGMRMSQCENYRDEQTRREQSTMDDNFSSRRRRQ